jgi:hypothetical protein
MAEKSVTIATGKEHRFRLAGWKLDCSLDIEEPVSLDCDLALYGSPESEAEGNAPLEGESEVSGEEAAEALECGVEIEEPVFLECDVGIVEEETVASEEPEETEASPEA